MSDVLGGWLGSGGHEPPITTVGPGWALARRADGLTSAIVALHGWDGAASAVAHSADANAYGPHSATPYLTLPTGAGSTGCSSRWSC